MAQLHTPVDEAINPEDTYSAARPADPIYQAAMFDLIIEIVRRKWLIARITGVALAIGLILCFVLPVRFTAITKIMPPKQSPSMAALLMNQMAAGALSQAAGASFLADPNSIYIGLLRSRPIADQIIGRYRLVNEYRAKDITAARKLLSAYTSIVSESSTLISISVTDRDKQRAADIANSYADELRRLSSSVSMTEAARRRAFFQDQLHAQKEALVEAEVAFQKVQQNKGLIHLDAQAGSLISGIATLRGQMAAKEVELNALRSYSTENNPEVQLAEHELASLQQQATQMEGRRQANGYSDIALRDVAGAGLDYVRAQREVQYQQSFFDVLLRQFEAAKLDEAKEAAVIQVVEPAVAPERKSSPRRMVIMILSAILGLFAGILVAVSSFRIEMMRANPQGAAALRKLREAICR